MAAKKFTVFLSAVSNEFGKVRDRIAADLRSRGLTVKVQSDFRAEADADTVLALLHNYIRDCDAVVCVVGRRSGSCPTPAEATPFRDMLPGDIGEASYTQWEFFFARAYKRRLSTYVPGDKYRPDQRKAPASDRPDLQQRFVRHIIDLGLHRIPAANAGELRAEILREDWPDLARPKPIVLPYQSIGSLFKGYRHDQPPRQFFRRHRAARTRRADRRGRRAILARPHRRPAPRRPRRRGARPRPRRRASFAQYEELLRESRDKGVSEILCKASRVSSI
jgi:hypothetical protein